MPRLTNAGLSKLNVPEGKRREIFDSVVPGFGVRFGGREKSFFLAKRIKGTRKKVRVTIGTFPAMTLEEARIAALALADRIAAGENPGEEQRRRKQERELEDNGTFAAIVDRFLKQYCRGKARPLRTSTIQGYEWSLLGHCGDWSHLRIDAVTDRHVIALIDQLEAERKFVSARLVRANLHRFFEWCCEKRLLERNPVSRVVLASSPSDFHRDRALTVPELRQVLRAADTLSAAARAFAYALVLTGQRRGETRLMKWADLDLTGARPVWRIPAENAKNRRAHDVPLCAALVGVLSGLPRLSDFALVTGGGPAPDGNGPLPPIGDLSMVKKKLDAAIEADRCESRPNDNPIAPWRWHDLRRSAATGMADLGVAPHVIEAILNHVSGHKAGVAGVYNRSTYETERRRALEAWATHLLCEDVGKNVVPIVAIGGGRN